MTKTHSALNRPLLGLAALFGLMVVLLAAQKAAGSFFIAPVQLAILAAFVAGALWLTWRYWLAIDEAARDAQKTAWFWGGSLALIPGTVLLNTLAAPGVGFLDWLATHAPNFSPLVLGGLILAVIQLAGFLVAWAIWWAGKR
ncbi:MAG: hypothetical protein ACREE0_15155 [Phenylobacterium sp.]